MNELSYSVVVVNFFFVLYNLFYISFIYFSKLGFILFKKPLISVESFVISDSSNLLFANYYNYYVVLILVVG